MPSITQLKSFLIDAIIRNQDIKKLETTCFGLTLAILKFHLEKLFVRFVTQLCNKSYEQLFKMKPENGQY